MSQLQTVLTDTSAYPGFYNEGVHRGGSRTFPKRGQAKESGDGIPQVGPRGKVSRGGLGDEVPQKLKQNVKLVYSFSRFPAKM